MSRSEAKERRRQQVLAAAEAFIRRDGTVDFSMKDLARDAEVSFATPFNLFGKKEDILAALFNRRVSEHASRNSERNATGEGQAQGLENLLYVALDSCDGYLCDAELFRPLAQSFRMHRTPQLTAISNSAQAIWKDALQSCQDEKIVAEDINLDELSRRLHISFRVAFGMWASSELTDAEFRQQALYGAVSCLLPNTTPTGRQKLTTLIESDPSFKI